MPHRDYTDDNGERYPSVTEVLSYPPKPWLEKWRAKWGKRAEQKARAAANIGTKLHKKIEDFLQTGRISIDYRKRVDCMFALWLKWQEESSLKVQEIETHVVSKRYKYQGTLDAIGTLRNRLEIGKRDLS